jgi:hypothetical protein
VPHLKLVKSGNLIEVYNYEKSISQKIHSGRRKSFKQRDSRPLSSRPDNIRRRCKSFTRLVQSNLVGSVAPALFTLTVAERVGIERGYEYLREFWIRLRQASISYSKYIAVPEFQKRGAIHFHLIIWGLNEYVDQERNNRQIQNLWQRGFVDCIQSDGSSKIAGYLAKYMRKSMFDRRLVGQKAYSASRSCLRSVSFSSPAVFNFSSEVFGIDLETALPVVDKQFNTQWLGSARYRLYVLDKDL